MNSKELSTKIYLYYNEAELLQAHINIANKNDLVEHQVYFEVTSKEKCIKWINASIKAAKIRNNKEDILYLSEVLKELKQIHTAKRIKEFLDNGRK